MHLKGDVSEGVSLSERFGGSVPCSWGPWQHSCHQLTFQFLVCNQGLDREYLPRQPRAGKLS